MTKAKLIKALEGYPDDKEIVVVTDDWFNHIQCVVELGAADVPNIDTDRNNEEYLTNEKPLGIYLT